MRLYYCLLYLERRLGEIGFTHFGGYRCSNIYVHCTHEIVRKKYRMYTHILFLYNNNNNNNK